MNNAAMYICIQAFVWTYVSSSFEYIPRSEIAKSYGISILTFWETTQLFPVQDVFTGPWDILNVPFLSRV